MCVILTSASRIAVLAENVFSAATSQICGRHMHFVHLGRRVRAKGGPNVQDANVTGERHCKLSNCTFLMGVRAEGGTNVQDAFAMRERHLVCSMQCV